METGHDILKRIEAHCGEKVGNRRLRFQIEGELDRLIERHEGLKSNIENVLSGHSTYNESNYKAIRRSTGRKSYAA